MSEGNVALTWEFLKAFTPQLGYINKVKFSTKMHVWIYIFSKCEVHGDARWSHLQAPYFEHEWSFLCSSCICVCFLCVLQSSPTSQKHVSRYTGYAKLLIDVKVCAWCPAMNWCPILALCLVILTMIKRL